MTMRDAFWKQITEMAKEDSRIMIVTADMSAPGLDWFRTNFPHRYINVGIAEQCAIQVACGLCLEQMKPIVYAIQPFVSLRCYEQVKAVASLMNIPITIAGVGAGFSYADSGPTHHALEDVAIMRILPHVRVWNPSSNSLAAYCARQIGTAINYIRLDRDELSEIHYRPLAPSAQLPDMDRIFSDGFIVHIRHDKRYLVATGCMVHTALEAAEKADIGVVEVFRLPTESKLHDTVSGKKLYVLEENNSRGGLFADMCEQVTHSVDSINHLAVGVNDGYEYIYGGRNNIHKHYGIDAGSVIEWLS